MAKLCKRCGEKPATVPDRDRPGRFTPAVCDDCHTRELGGDFLRAVAPKPQPDCAARLWNAGKPSPRTCERCKLGPCEFGEVRRPTHLLGVTEEQMIESGDLDLDGNATEED